MNAPYSIGIFDDVIGRVGYRPYRTKSTIVLGSCWWCITFLTHLSGAWSKTRLTAWKLFYHPHVAHMQSLHLYIWYERSVFGLPTLLLPVGLIYMYTYIRWCCHGNTTGNCCTRSVLVVILARTILHSVPVQEVILKSIRSGDEWWPSFY